MMRIKDPIYGTFELNSPVLEHLICSQPLQRLRDIAQFSVPDKYHCVKNFSRFEHAVGTMLVLRVKGALITTQIAGLLHDVAMPAFSHLGEWVFGDTKKEELSEENHREFISKTEIPRILWKHGIDLEQVVDSEKHPPLEMEAPLLCADRIDYGLRDVVADRKLIWPTIKDLDMYDGHLVFKTKDAARAFAYNQLHCQQNHWGATENNVRWEIFRRALRWALEDKVICKEDFYKRSDSYIVAKLETCNDLDIQNVLHQLSSPKLRYREVDPTKEKPDVSVDKKFRWVNPHYVANGGSVYLLSKNDPDFRAYVRQQRALNEKGIHVVLEN